MVIIIQIPVARTKHKKAVMMIIFLILKMIRPGFNLVRHYFLLRCTLS